MEKENIILPFLDASSWRHVSLDGWEIGTILIGFVWWIKGGNEFYIHGSGNHHLYEISFSTFLITYTVVHWCHGHMKTIKKQWSDNGTTACNVK